MSKEEESDNKAHNKGGIKKYRDFVVGLLEKDQIENKIRVTEFPEQTESLEDTSSKEVWTEEQEGKIAPMLKSGSEEIEHGENPHSFEHEIPESAKVQGQQSSGLTKVAKLDKPSDE
jgi:hypothetical protein